MDAVPVSARWLSGLGVVAFLLPVVAVADELGTAAVFLYAAGLLCVVACAVPPFFRDPKRFRVACAAAGMGVAAASIPAGLVGILFAVAIEGWPLYLAFLALPSTAIAGLIAAFQRARGRECGQAAAGVAWACAAITVIGWAYITAEALAES
ncbi:hypothetical protein GCM10018790_18390 [Kitasatospora xanthocidica]|uniref:hypothetical protein n=1 Tax=Kitasatospora xanthocidica TaxID=83382 RepID=UPI00167A719B|nr:hypothetical protein [Kitasatospora xanthocidica]GHF41081.1 hypothetical protein GCM10018790_18390 [Kitasatospora xanthocidica]